MKKISLKNKLNLNKQLVSTLNTAQMNQAVGGKLTKIGCKTTKICGRLTADTYCSVSIACVQIDNDIIIKGTVKLGD